jgi:hypothetical protein
VVWRQELGMLVNWTDILDGAIANAAWGVASMVAKPRTSRRVAADLDTAAWADTDRLIRDALAEIATKPEIPDLSEVETAVLMAVLNRNEVHGALQALLAVRLTDAPETDAAKAREAVRLALAAGATSLSLPGVRYAVRLSKYFDEKISALVATLEGQVGFAGLAQVRAEAYNARIVALLGAIERQVTALADPTRRSQGETEFLERYRRQAHQQHGFLMPPDFDRRRRVPIDDIYVPTSVKEGIYFAPDQQTHGAPRRPLTVWDLVGLVDRTVLLGDPGGGKTTAANVLADYFADDAARSIPFLVTLREYAAKASIEWSVAEHIEHKLKTLYQVPAPGGLVERLLLTGRAVVIFDGLDELLDTSRRRDVSDRVEQFCAAYPLTPVLVTSRVVGYDQARLDDMQFTCYRLGGFGDDEVGEYAGKWFATQEGIPATEAAAKAKAFLAESSNAKDLRANPLLLSLMCILYRGAGSLPADRSGIYARCAELLLRKWDEQRDLYRKLGSDHLVEPTLRYLAWWLFTRKNSRAAATERELITKTTEFLFERAHESQDEARAAANEFVEFCRGRMWVFSDAGTTADGEKLYAFTHRTFLEYFTAAYLSAVSDSPEDLARALATHASNPGWDVVGELAIQLKDHNSDRGADRVYESLLADAGNLPIPVLIQWLESIQPSPSNVRKLTRAAVDFLVDHRASTENIYPLEDLLSRTDRRYRAVVADEMSNHVSAMVDSDEMEIRTYGLRIALMVRRLYVGTDDFWLRWSTEQARIYGPEILLLAKGDIVLRAIAVHFGNIKVTSALAMPGGFDALMQANVVFADRDAGGGHHQSTPLLPAYPESICQILFSETPDQHQTAISELTAIGRYLLESPALPLVHIASRTRMKVKSDFIKLLRSTERFPILDEVACLGFAAVVCVTDELKQEDDRRASSSGPELSTGTERLLYRYLIRRRTGSGNALPELPVPPPFRQVFLDWAEGRVDFVEFVAEESKG